MAADDCTTKRCGSCAAHKPHSDFNKDKSTGDGLQSKCRPCQKEVRHKWYMANREQEIAKSLAWTKANPEKAREKDRRRAIKQPGRTTESAKLWRQSNPEQARKLRNDWKKRNPDKVRESARRRYKEDPDKDLAKMHLRRITIKANGGYFTKAQIENLYKLQNGCCSSCRKKLNRKFHRDHILPVARGGSNNITNIQLLCPSCNAKKSAKDPIHFMQEMGFLI